MERKFLEVQPIPITRELVTLAVLGLVIAACFLGAIDLSLLSVILLIIGLYLAIIFTVLYSIQKRTTYVVYADRVERNVNWILKSAGRIDAMKIESVQVTNSLLGRDRYGRVTVIGSGGTKLVFSAVPNPTNFAHTVRSIMNEGKPLHAKSETSCGPTDDLATQIQKLESLRNQGILDAAEFRKAKRKLLDS